MVKRVGRRRAQRGFMGGTRWRLAAVGLALAAVGGEGAAQCTKPVVPVGGFSTSRVVDQVVTYGDGYRTLADLTYPHEPAPACGWPLVVLVHSFAGSRLRTHELGDELAARGFAVWAYDVRGQGDAQALNPPTEGTTFYGPDEKFDLAEQVAHVRAAYAGLIDPEKLGVSGESQGGAHAWFAAALSGRTITVDGRGTIEFPEVDAAVPRIFVPDAHDVFVRDGTLFDADFFGKRFSGPVDWTPDAGYVAHATQKFLEQDPEGLAADWAAEPWRRWREELSDTGVPVLWMHAYLDGVASPRMGVEAIEELQAVTKARMLLSTEGHDSRSNAREKAFRRQLLLRWMDRFLWGQKNGVEREAVAVRAAVPMNLSELNDPSYLWGHRFDEEVVAADVVPKRFYLTASGALSPFDGKVPGPPTSIVHSVPVGYDAGVWASSPAEREVDAVVANVPLSERAFATLPLPGEIELGGRGQVHLTVTPDAPRYQLAVLLLARIPGAADDFMLCARGIGVRDAVPGLTTAVELELPPAVAVLPAGTVLRVVVRNHWIREAPMQRRFVAAPYFESASVDLHHGASVSWLDLPVRGQVRAALKSPVVNMSLASPVVQPLELDGGTGFGGDPYVILLTSSGQVPGVQLPDANLPLNYDSYTNIVVSAVLSGHPATPGFSGALDPKGKATAMLDWVSLIPLPSVLAGQRMTFAAWLMSAQDPSQNRTTNPVDLMIR